MGQVPESLPVTDETKELLRQQANQLPEPTVLRLIDLLAVAVEDMRQGGDPRLPLFELAIVKVTRPHADLSRESLAHRVELLEEPDGSGGHQPSGHRPGGNQQSAPAPDVEEDAQAKHSPPQPEGQDAPQVELDQVVDAWQRSIVEAVRERSIPVASLLAEARPSELRETR